MIDEPPETAAARQAWMEAMVIADKADVKDQEASDEVLRLFAEYAAIAVPRFARLFRRQLRNRKWQEK